MEEIMYQLDNISIETPYNRLVNIYYETLKNENKDIDTNIYNELILYNKKICFDTNNKEIYNNIDNNFKMNIELLYKLILDCLKFYNVGDYTSLRENFKIIAVIIFNMV
jgi:hypothetical protein